MIWYGKQRIALRARFQTTPHVEEIHEGLYHCGELIIGVFTDLPYPHRVPLPEGYAGFRVLQFGAAEPKVEATGGRSEFPDARTSASSCSRPLEGRVSFKDTENRPSSIGRSKAMRTRGDNGVGRFSVEIEVVNDADMVLAQAGHLPADQIRRATIQGLVDSGATKLVLPEALVKRLGLRLGDPINVRCADGRRARRRVVERVYVQLLGRHGTFTAICEPKRETALIGAIVLEDLDLLVDCVAQRVVPRDPSGATYEIE